MELDGGGWKWRLDCELEVEVGRSEVDGGGDGGGVVVGPVADNFKKKLYISHKLLRDK